MDDLFKFIYVTVDHTYDDFTLKFIFKKDNDQVSFGIRDIKIHTINCPQFCNKCSNFYKCTECKSGYYLFENRVCLKQCLNYVKASNSLAIYCDV